jgi:3-oxoacyl-[acyl-carrier-protein] synthase-3
VALFSIDHINVAGLSVVVPKNRTSNFDLPGLSEQERNNLVKTTGIETRRIADDATTAADLCIRSAELIMDALNWDRHEVEILVFVTQTPDHTIPGTSMFIQEKLGLTKNCICLDINQGCAGYVYGLSVIASMMSSAKIRKGLLLVGDTITKTIQKNDPALTPVFSDAGSCTALEWDDTASTMYFNLQTDGSGFDKIIVREGGARIPVKDKEACLYMNGQDIFNFGLKEVALNADALLTAFKLDKEEIDYFVMHQANLLLNETIRKKLGMTPDKIWYSLKDYGNTSSASIPVTIAANARQIKEGSKARYLLSGFGVGLSWGSVVVDLKKTTYLPVHEY